MQITTEPRKSIGFNWKASSDTGLEAHAQTESGALDMIRRMIARRECGEHYTQCAQRVI